MDKKIAQDLTVPLEKWILDQDFIRTLETTVRLARMVDQDPLNQPETDLVRCHLERIKESVLVLSSLNIEQVTSQII